MKCNVCGTDIPNFLPKKYDGEDSLECPICGSQPRHRALLKGFGSTFEMDGMRIVHIGGFVPLVKKLWKTLEPKPTVSYLPMDVRPRSPEVVLLDVAQVELVIQDVDFVICLYVLEEVVDENKALKNIFKNIKAGGKMIFDSPLKKGKTDRPELFPGAEEREGRFGNARRLRRYGEDDIKDVLDSYGFKTKYQNVPPDKDIGLDKPYRFIIAEKE